MYTLQMKRLFLSSGKWSNVGFLDFFKGKKKNPKLFFSSQNALGRINFENLVDS